MHIVVGRTTNTAVRRDFDGGRSFMSLSDDTLSLRDGNGEVSIDFLSGGTPNSIIRCFWIERDDVILEGSIPSGTKTSALVVIPLESQEVL